ncbi:Alpha/Beta hydrolase protein [Emericellopsis atlantica]|uniref:Alpha/Beta hydrolase protein n=1 Tax=Emericellopsis atlantica TaxID=2614577 RepID=A0A9P8CK75_9HYPO|nr:Alpha/Beta hydrolase protein [Emericellopsis atlantica]KAG9249762.1 Alpha/Beta hydrolase protein [Emericellopsis atlantica]
MSTLNSTLTALARRAYGYVLSLGGWIRTVSALAFRRGACNEQQMSLIATDTIRLLQDGDWAGLRGRFALPLRLLLTETALRKGWQVITATTGPIERVGRPSIKTTMFLPTAKIPVYFARANLAVVLRMWPSGRLLGLQVSPLLAAGFGVAWQCPPYTEDGYARETDIELGSKLEVPGIFCLPKHTGPHACVVFLAGSGPCDRDSSVGSLKPFKDLALGLAQKGIASIRFDKVTLRHGQKFRNRSSFTIADEYFDQANAALNYASQHPEIESGRIFLLGHSLGATVVPHLAQVDNRIRGIVLLAPPSETMYKSYARQLRYFASLDSDLVESTQELIAEAEKKSDAADRLGPDSTTAPRDLPFGLPACYWNSCRELDPIGTCQAMDKPILLLQGSRDYQVTVEDDFTVWKRELRSKQDVVLSVLEGLDHCFVRGEGLSVPADYDNAGNMDATAIENIRKWIVSTCGGSQSGT